MSTERRRDVFGRAAVHVSGCLFETWPVGICSSNQSESGRGYWKSWAIKLTHRTRALLAFAFSTWQSSTEAVLLGPAVLKSFRKTGHVAIGVCYVVR